MSNKKVRKLKIMDFKTILKKISLLHKFFCKAQNNKVSQYFSEKLHRVSSGFVMILFIALIPIILLGTKYILDQSTLNKVKIETEDGTGNFYKACARDAALAVAKNWNPGLNLSYQKDALMKIADAIYNDNVTRYGGSGILGQAVPGIDVKQSPKAIKDPNKFMPLKVSWNHLSTLPPGTKKIEYTEETKYLLRYYRGYYVSGTYDGKSAGVYGNTLFRMWREIDLNTAPSYRYSDFDEIDETERSKQNYILKHHDIYGLPGMGWQGHFTNYPYYPTNGYFWPGCSSYHSAWIMTIPSTSSSVSQYYPWKYHSSSSTTGTTSSTTTTYKKRTTPSGTDPVTITIDNDRIKVTTDSNTNYVGTIGYAQPAQCNVDIVLAIPVNGAACNASNNDEASATAGTPTDTQEYSKSSTYPTQTTPSFSSTVTSMPLYQMGQACKNFVKDNFYHIKGVTMGLIPYSAKVSISPDKASNYTIAIPKFVEFTTTNPYYPTAAMYGTSGEKDAPLVQDYKTTAIGSGQTLPTTDTPYYWGGMLTGCPIMCRRGSKTTWNNTQLAYGNLLSNVQPSSGDQYKYMRMNLNPCLAGYANQLSMKCERKCTHFFPNPYYMIEPTSDMVKIYEMCNALFPVYDPNNVSNFLFIPFEWANNFWQSWTNDVTTSAGTNVLSRPSKTTSGRKKVLVMLVNKPDWFEPGEMTYLGFDNDYSAVPLAESDKIDFSINYSDTSKKFLDGTAYSGIPKGPKQIIRYATQSGTIARNSSTGDFECTGSGTGRLYIPRPATVRLTVKNRGGSGGDIKSGNLNWRYYSQALNTAIGTSCSAWNYLGEGYAFSAAYKNGIFAIISGTGYYSVYSNDGNTWHKGNTISPNKFLNAMTANDSYFVALGTDSVAYSSDGQNWTSQGVSGVIAGWTMDDDILWNGSQFLATSQSWYNVTDVKNGVSGWNDASSNTNRIGDREQFKYGGGYYVKKYSSNNYVRSSTNKYYSSYNQYDLPLSRLGALNYGPGYWVILTQYGDVMCSADAQASSWVIVDGSSSNTTSSSLYSKSGGKTNWVGICYGGGKWIAYTRSGDVAVLDDSGNSDPGTIKFTNIGDTTTYTISDEKTFTIEPSQISSTSGSEYYVEFNVSNLKLISAEVTNLSYSYVNPINATYNEVEMIGPSGSSANMSWGTRNVSVSDRYIYQTSGNSSNGNFYISPSGLTSYDSSCGYYPSSKDSQKSVYVYSDTNQPVTLYFSSYTPNASSGGSGSITFYSDNGVEDNVGTHNVSGTQTFTFSGGSMPTTSSSYQIGSTCGVNFSHNLSVKKVRYSLSSATITNCVLRNQIIRDYIGYYGRNHPSYKQLILNDESKASRGSNSNDAYNPYATYSVSSGDISVASDSDIKISKFMDSNIKYLENYNVSVYSSTYINIQTSNKICYVLIYGVSPSFLVSMTRNINCDYYASTGYNSIATNVGDNNIWSPQYSVTSSSGYGSSGVKLRFYGGLLWQFFVQNQNPKYLQSTTPITSNPITYSNLINNVGIYLANYSSQNWICFQGDGQLEVTVKASGETYSTPYVKIPSNTSGSYNTYNLSTSHGTNYSYTIPSAAFTWDESNQRYYTSYPVYLYNASLRYVYQPGTTITYPALLANNNYSVTYSYNNYSGSRVVNTGSTSNYDSSLGKYYLHLPRNTTPKFAARKYSVSETVYDMIDFSANTTSSKNGYLSTNFNGSYSSNFYYFGSSSVTKTLTSSRKGRLELKVAPSFYADSGYIKMNYGSDTSAKTITAPTTLSMKYSDLSSGTMQFTLYNCVILYAKLCDVEAVINSPNQANTRLLMWNTSSPSASNISLSGSYSNWYADEGWHKLSSSSFVTWNNSYASDITSVLDAKSPISAYWYMPQNVYTDYANTNLVGPMRLFAPITRDASLTPRKYCQMYAYSSTYSNKANLLWHDFTLPLNYVLYRAGYQSVGGDATAATRSATAAVCAKLKTDYGSNLRVYIVKYRKQTQYKTFPNYNVTQSNANHDYSVIDACATSSSYVYDVSTESDLKATLNTIANDIKSFAGGVTAARNVD